jgi:DNA polymerase-3 subunit beta
MIDSETMLASGVLKLSASRDALADRLGLVARGVSSRTAVLVLGGIQLRAGDGQLQLAATDMELSLRASLEADVDGDGEVVVPGRLLLDIVRALPDNDVQLEHRSDEAMLHITSGSASYRVHTYSAEDFPRLPDVDALQLHPVDRDALLETIGRVGRSASRDESRPVLTGILVRFEHDKLVMAATDSYRLAVKETPAPGGLPELEAIIPARALQELSRLAAGADEVQLGLHENHVVFGAEGAWLTTRRIDGQFPNYRQLMPEQFEHELQLPREELLDVVRRVSLMAQRNSPLRLRFADGELTVSAQTPDVGEARESLPAPFNADAMEIGFNAEFLRDGLDSVDSQTVRLKLISPLRPAVLEGETSDYTYLIMPIRLAG